MLRPHLKSSRTSSPKVSRQWGGRHIRQPLPRFHEQAPKGLDMSRKVGALGTAKRLLRNGATKRSEGSLAALLRLSKDAEHRAYIHSVACWSVNFKTSTTRSQVDEPHLLDTSAAEVKGDGKCRRDLRAAKTDGRHPA